MAPLVTESNYSSIRLLSIPRPGRGDGATVGPRHGKIAVLVSVSEGSAQRDDLARLGVDVATELRVSIDREVPVRMPQRGEECARGTVGRVLHVASRA